MKEVSATSKYLSFSNQNIDYKIPIEHILYIESNRRKLTIHTVDDEFYCYDKLDTMEQILNQTAFIRCNQSYLVAIDQIISYGNHCLTLQDSEFRIPVSRQYQKILRDFLQTQPEHGALVGMAGTYESSIIRIKPEQRILIGRDGTVSDIVIVLPMVSRLHCEIIYHKNTKQYEIIDYSSNGTYINGTTRLVPNQSYMLCPETELSFGDTLSIFKLI